MTERERADIEIRLGSSLITTVPITAESRRVRKLMESDYIRLEFKTDEPVEFPLGAFVNDEIFGKFYITDEQAPSFNQALHGYDYKLQFNAHYYRWQKQFFCMLRTLGDTEVRSEKMWTLTTSLRNQMREFMINLQILGYVDSSYNFRANDIALDTFVVIDESVETRMQSLTMSYSSTYMLDALKTMADTWGCEYWIEGDETNFKIHFGTCEYGTTEQIISLDSFTEDGEEVPATAETMSFDKDMSDGSANLLYYFGGTQNIPNTYRKELRLKACDVVTSGGKVQKFNGCKELGGERIDLYKYIKKAFENTVGRENFYIKLNYQSSARYLLKALPSAETDDSLIYSMFRSSQPGYSTDKVRRFMGIRVCGAVRVNINGRDEVVRILSQEDLNHISGYAILDIRTLAELVIAEYDENNGQWINVEYAPISLSHLEWFELTQSNDLNGILRQKGATSSHVEGADFTYEGYEYTDTGHNVEVNLPSGQSESSYLVNVTPLTQWLQFYRYLNVLVGYSDFNLATSDDEPTKLPCYGKFNPDKRINVSLIVNGGSVSPSDADTQFEWLLDNAKLTGSATIALKSNYYLTDLEWEKIAENNPDSFFKTNGRYYLKLYNDSVVELTPQGDGMTMSYTTAWNQSKFDNVNWDLTDDFPVLDSDCASLSDSVWVAQEDTTIFHYYENANFANNNYDEIAEIDVSDGTSSTNNLCKHVERTLSNNNRKGTLGFCTDVNFQTVMGNADIVIPAQSQKFKIELDWGSLDFDTAQVDFMLYIAFGISEKSNDQWNYSRISGTRPAIGDPVAYVGYIQPITISRGGASGEELEIELEIDETNFVLDDEDFWYEIRHHVGSSGFLPYIIAVADVDYIKSGQHVYPSSGSVEVSLLGDASMEWLHYTLVDYRTNAYEGYIEDPTTWYDEHGNLTYELGTGTTSYGHARSQILNVFSAGIDSTDLTVGTEFVLYSDYDLKVPYMWFTDELDNPASVLSVGDIHLQLPVINEKKFEQYKLPGMSLLRSGGYLYIVKDGMAYRDGCVFSLDMIQNPDGYFPNEKCVINENIYPMAICLIERQSTTKGVFTEDKTEYVNIEGEDASNRLSYPWQQYHVNIGIPTINGSTTTIEELEFSKDYVLQNSQPLKMRFLVPNDVKDLVASDVMSLLEDNAHCKLAGMTFEVAFNAQTSYKHSGSATATVHKLDYAIARNEDFGAKLPSDVLCPSNLDPCVLENWNVKALSAMGLMDKAEYRLLDKAFEYYKAMHDNNLTVTADMMSDWMFLMTGRYDTLVEADDKILVESQDKVLKARGGMEEYSIPDIGMKVCVKHASLKNGEKHTRVLGYEMKLDKPYDTPKLIMGESEATSRLKILEKEITKLS